MDSLPCPIKAVEIYLSTTLTTSTTSPPPCADLSKLCRLSPQQQRAIQASIAQPPTSSSGIPTPSSGCSNVVAIALSRPNALLHLQMKVEEAGKQARAGSGSGSGPGFRAGPLAGSSSSGLAAALPALAVAASSSAAEQQLLFFFPALFGGSPVTIVNRGAAATGKKT